MVQTTCSYCVELFTATKAIHTAAVQHCKGGEKQVCCLLEDGVLPGLADDEVGPLHHHDRHEEGGVAGVLQDLTVPINVKIISQ
jgi:hypothetical protein